MQKQREAFALLWRNEMAAAAKSLGIHPTPAVEHLAWLSFKQGAVASQPLANNRK